MEARIEKLLSGPVVVINLGLGQFANSLEEQGVEVVQVQWTPPASDDQEMKDLLAKLV